MLHLLDKLLDLVHRGQENDVALPRTICCKIFPFLKKCITVPPKNPLSIFMGDTTRKDRIKVCLPKLTYIWPLRDDVR